MRYQRLTAHGAGVESTLVLLVVGALALAACGGSGQATSTSTPAFTPSAAASSAGTTSGSTSPVATPTKAAQVAAAFAALAAEGKPTAGLYAEDAVLQDRSYGALNVGVEAIRKFQEFWSGVGGPSPTRALLVGGDGFIVESVFAGFEYVVDVLRVRGGKVVADYVYYDDLQQGPAMNAPTPLETPPAAGDTEAASGAVAKAYMAALRALSPARLAALYAPEVVYIDTGRDALYKGPSAALGAHARMFALNGLRFQANGVLNGPGWAAVMWQRSDREGGKPLVDIPASTPDGASARPSTACPSSRSATARSPARPSTATT
jgi:hypothetical protein